MSTLYDDVKKRSETQTEVSTNAGSGTQGAAPAVTYIDNTSGEADERGNVGTAPLASPQVATPAPPPTPTPQAPKAQTMYELVQQYAAPQSYEAEIADAARRKRLGNWADALANLVDIGTAFAGRRLYSPHAPSAVKEADARLIKLKDLQRAENLRYNNALMNARYKDILQDRADKIQAKADADKAADRAEAGRQREIDNDLKKRKFEADQEAAKETRALRKAEAEANAAYRKASLGLEQQRLAESIKQHNSSASTANTDYLLGKDGAVSVFPKAASGAVAGWLYNRMKQIVSEDKTGKRSLDESLIAIDANGDTNAKVLNVVRKNIANFPELQAELNTLLEQGVFGKQSTSSASISSGSNTPMSTASSGTQPIVYTPGMSSGNVSPQVIEWHPGMPIK